MSLLDKLTDAKRNVERLAYKTMLKEEGIDNLERTQEAEE